MLGFLFSDPSAYRLVILPRKMFRTEAVLVQACRLQALVGQPELLPVSHTEPLGQSLLVTQAWPQIALGGEESQ